MELYNFSITGDSYFSMSYGPILSNHLDFIKDNYYLPEDDKNYWRSFLSVQGYDLIINCENTKQDLETFLSDDNMELSDAEIEILDEIDAYFKDKKYNEVIDVIHNKNKYPEIKWEEASVQQTSLPILVEDILQAVGRTEEQIAYIIDNLTQMNRDSL